MKKIICLFAILCITLSLFNVAFATDGDKQLEDAILKAKEILEIDDNEYVIENFRNGNNGYELSWKSKVDDKKSWINLKLMMIIKRIILQFINIQTENILLM